MNILVGSENPVKIEATREAFSKYFSDVQVRGIAVPSGVSHQPLNDETFLGARQRALELRVLNEEQRLGAPYVVGIEGGIQEWRLKGEPRVRYLSFGVACILDEKGRSSYGATPHFELSAGMMGDIGGGLELGEITDRFTGVANSKQKGGIIGYLTKGVMMRKDLYVPALVAALVPFVNEELYFPQT